MTESIWAVIDLHIQTGGGMAETAVISNRRVAGNSTL